MTMQNNIFTLLVLGDVVGQKGVNRVHELLPKLKKEFSPDLTVVNGENASDRNGLDAPSADTLIYAGADVITGGNHTLAIYDIYDRLDDDDRLLRPANFQPLCPGKGYTVVDCGALRVLVMNVSGQVFMNPCDNPFVCAERILKEQSGKYDISICDIHAEATSEKSAFAQYFDGRINFVFGTHTHVPTADEQVLPNGTGFISDVGMCGVAEGTVLGVASENVINRFITGKNERFNRRVEGKAELNGAVFRYDTAAKRCVSVERIKKK